MIRTQIQLTEEQAAALKRIARRRGVSISALIRESVEATIADGDRAAAWRRALAAVGSIQGDGADVARDHDRYLDEAYRS